jgi:hypothetical protein
MAIFDSRKVAPLTERLSLSASALLSRGAVFVHQGLCLKFLKPILKEYQQIRVGDGPELFGMDDLVHQTPAHLRWVDTFAHALCQSQMDETGHLVALRLLHQVHQKSLAGVPADSLASAMVICDRASSGAMWEMIVKSSSIRIISLRFVKRWVELPENLLRLGLTPR